MHFSPNFPTVLHRVLPVCPEETNSSARSSNQNTPKLAQNQRTSRQKNVQLEQLESSLAVGEDVIKKDALKDAHEEIEQKKEVTVATSSVMFVRQADNPKQSKSKSFCISEFFGVTCGLDEYFGLETFEMSRHFD